MSLGSVTTHLQKLAAALVSSKPDRDALAAERDRLLAAPPPAPANTLALPEPLTCTCDHCLTRAREEQATRVAHAAWAGRIKALETGLFQLTWGNPDSTDDDAKGRDEPGLALGELCGDLLRAVDSVRRTPWERVIIRDGRGKPREAWSTTDQLAAQIAELVGLRRRATDVLIFLPAAELTTAIAETRARMGAALVAQLKQPMDPALAERVGTEPGELGEAERHGLTPSPTNPSVTEGTIRFSRRGRA